MKRTDDPRRRVADTDIPTNDVLPKMTLHLAVQNKPEPEPHHVDSANTTVRFDFSPYIESIYALYAGALAHDHLRPDAHIPVEQINGPIMLISGKDDALWPSSDMSDRVVKRLEQRHFKFSVQHLSYQYAGHAVAMPPSAQSVSDYPDEAIGGTAAGN